MAAGKELGEEKKGKKENGGWKRRNKEKKWGE